MINRTLIVYVTLAARDVPFKGCNGACWYMCTKPPLIGRLFQFIRKGVQTPKSHAYS